MMNDESEQRGCDLRLVLVDYGGIHTWYDSQAGLRQRFRLVGWIRDPYCLPFGDIDESHGDSLWHDRPVNVEVSSPPDSKWLNDVVASLGGSHVFGAVAFPDRVDPDEFENEGKSLDVEPVYARLDIEPQAFEAIARQAAEAYKHRRVMWGRLRLVGDTLPEPDNVFAGVKPKNLDISNKSEYGVAAFEIFDTIYTDNMRGRVLQIPKRRDENYGTALSIRLTRARYDILSEYASFRSISCDGRIIDAKAKFYEGCDVTIEFTEHERSRYNGLPKRAFFGEFSYFPGLTGPSYSSGSFVFYLRYLPEDIHRILLPTLNNNAATHVNLTVFLVDEEANLLAATEEIR